MGIIDFAFYGSGVTSVTEIGVVQQSCVFAQVTG